MCVKTTVFRNFSLNRYHYIIFVVNLVGVKISVKKKSRRNTILRQTIRVYRCIFTRQERYWLGKINCVLPRKGRRGKSSSRCGRKIFGSKTPRQVIMTLAMARQSSGIHNNFNFSPREWPKLAYFSQTRDHPVDWSRRSRADSTRHFHEKAIHRCLV